MDVDHASSVNVSAQDHELVNRPPPTALNDSDIKTMSMSSPTNSDLDDLRWGGRLHGPAGHENIRGNASDDPESLETGGIPTQSNTANPAAISYRVPSVSWPYMNHWRICACCIAFFVQGLNDSAPGALLPYMEAHYNIKYAMVSLIFVANALGWIIAAPFVHTLNNRFGRARVLSCCTILNSIAYAILVSQPPFAVIVIAFLVLGELEEHTMFKFPTDRFKVTVSQQFSLLTMSS